MAVKGPKNIEVHGPTPSPEAIAIASHTKLEGKCRWVAIFYPIKGREKKQIPSGNLLHSY